MKFRACVLALFACSCLMPTLSAAQTDDGRPPVVPPRQPMTYESLQSWLTSVQVKSVTPDKTYNGVAYVKITGVVHGQVGINDFVSVHNLIDHKRAVNPFEAGTDSLAYESEFELIVPASGQKANEVVYVDAETQGAPSSQAALGGFLQAHATSYARVHWQTGISKGVPADTQGIGLVIVRDFARWLAGRTPQAKIEGDYKPVAYKHMVLGGISQGAWFVDTFIAEGFNGEPVTGKRVFDAAVAVDGAGNWLAINQIAAARKLAAQTPYLEPDGPPLSRAELLHNPRTDPLYIDIANYTDFYRVRAGLTSTADSDAGFRRYDWPSAHGSRGGAQCSGGQPATLNPISYAPYLRAVVWNVEKAIGAPAAQAAHGLPPSTIFTLGEPQPASDLFNPLPGRATSAPKVDLSGMPVGGVRFPEADHPTGRPDPAALPPVNTQSISALCGDLGGWKAFSAQELTERYKDRASYLAAYGSSLDQLVAQGYLLAEDRAGMVQAAEANWKSGG